MSEIQPIVVGTAGHIDHGKSSLVRALTGIDPDRLAEEKERGLTIDLGFANMELPDGRRIGIVDVPGHERFIRNMVAGASGIDLVVLVVAADDGVMPQTREHLAIMQLLGIRRGLVALTKVDMVDHELVEIVTDDLREFLDGTFLADAEIFPLSSISGVGLDAFRTALESAAAATEPRSADGVFRMPVQRVFTKAGFGTVCTGIPMSGVARAGDTLEVLPAGQLAKVRGIHAYGESAVQARAGHSSALNLSDLGVADVERGHVVATPGLFKPVRMVAARFEALPSLARAIEDRPRVRLHAGTADPSGELVLLDCERVEPGGTALVQLRLDEPAIVAPGDRFVLRLLSPERTLGGGQILEESRHRLKRFKSFVIDELALAESSLDSVDKLLVAVLTRRHLTPSSSAELAGEIKRAEPETRSLLERLIAAGTLVSNTRGDRFLAASALDAGFERLDAAAESWFEEHPERAQLTGLELRRQASLTEDAFEFLLSKAIEAGRFESLGQGQVRPAGRGVELDADSQAVLERLLEGGLRPPSPAELGASLGGEAAARAALARLVDLGRAVRANHEMFFADEPFEAAKEAVRANCERNGQLVIPELRELLQTSRKYLIPLLEHLDAIGFTMRQGAFRVLRRR